jgi:hypothetical protein
VLLVIVLLPILFFSVKSITASQTARDGRVHFNNLAE